MKHRRNTDTTTSFEIVRQDDNNFNLKTHYVQDMHIRICDLSVAHEVSPGKPWQLLHCSSSWTGHMQGLWSSIYLQSLTWVQAQGPQHPTCIATTMTAGWWRIAISQGEKVVVNHRSELIWSNAQTDMQTSLHGRMVLHVKLLPSDSSKNWLRIIHTINSFNYELDVNSAYSARYVSTVCQACSC
jgi:hypothetical protein